MYALRVENVHSQQGRTRLAGVHEIVSDLFGAAISATRAANSRIIATSCLCILVGELKGWCSFQTHRSPPCILFLDSEVLSGKTNPFYGNLVEIISDQRAFRV